VVKEPVTIKVSAVDNFAVAEVDVFVDNVLVATDTSAPYSVVWAGERGSHVIRAKAYDAAGNAGISNSVTVTVR
jgi:hypothetical protein